MPQIRLISDLRHFLPVNDLLHFCNILQIGKYAGIYIEICTNISRNS